MCLNLIHCQPLFSPQTLLDICGLLPQTKVPELVVSLVALSVLIVVKEVNACYSKKLPLPVPIELIVVSAPSYCVQHVCSFGSPAGGILTTVIILESGEGE